MVMFLWIIALLAGVGIHGQRTAGDIDCGTGCKGSSMAHQRERSRASAYLARRPFCMAARLRLLRLSVKAPRKCLAEIV